MTVTKKTFHHGNGSSMTSSVVWRSDRQTWAT